MVAKEESAVAAAAAAAKRSGDGEGQEEEEEDEEDEEKRGKNYVTAVGTKQEGGSDEPSDAGSDSFSGSDSDSNSEVRAVGDIVGTNWDGASDDRTVFACPCGIANFDFPADGLT